MPPLFFRKGSEKMTLTEFSNLQIANIKDKQVARQKYLYYFQIIEILMLTKFKIKNCPDNIYSDEILKSLLRGGVSAMTNKMNYDKKNFVGIPIESEPCDYTDRYEKARLVNVKGECADLKQHEEIAVGYNNTLHTPEYDIVWFAKILAETDNSMYCNVMNTRVSPLLTADNKAQAESLKKAIEDVYNGKLNVVTLNDIVSQMNTSGSNENRHTLYLTEPNNIDKIQYLSKFHDDLIRRLCNLHGITMNTTGKMAQITTAELNEYSDFSGMYIQSQYDLLCEYIEEANRINDWNMSVEYGDSFQRFVKKEMRADEVITEKLKESEVENDDINGVSEESENEQFEADSESEQDDN